LVSKNVDVARRGPASRSIAEALGNGPVAESRDDPPGIAGLKAAGLKAAGLKAAAG
jgi:hypothetical protein